MVVTSQPTQLPEFKVIKLKMKVEFLAVIDSFGAPRRSPGAGMEDTAVPGAVCRWCLELFAVGASERLCNWS